MDSVDQTVATMLQVGRVGVEEVVHVDAVVSTVGSSSVAGVFGLSVTRRRETRRVRTARRADIVRRVGLEGRCQGHVSSFVERGFQFLIVYLRLEM